ncbi:hypothetical protein L7F22_055754 [Adiantum nelumboides]|nr:hypothetical protein [Adiantum nelumboides]
MFTPKPNGRLRSFAAVVAASSKSDCLAQLEAVLNQVLEENRDLKARINKLETRLESLAEVATTKAKEVEAKVTQTHSALLAKVGSCVTTELRERRLQQENILDVFIGGLSPTWNAIPTDFSKRIDFLKDTLKPVEIEPDTIKCITAKGVIPSG